MKILALSDTQLGAGKSLLSERLADQQAVLDLIADLADEHEVDLVLHCGDVFESRHPDEEARMVFKRWARRVRAARPIIVVAGNHDLRAAEIASAVDLYDECEFVRRPSLLPVAETEIAVLPWTPPGLIVARRNGDRASVNEDMAALLVESARELREQCADGPSILALHWAISGAQLPNGLPVADLHEPVIPADDLAELGFDLVVAGHIHRAGCFHDSPPMLYCGSPAVCDWGESELPHGVWLLDTEAPGWPGSRFVEIEDRPFVTVDADISGDNDRVIDGEEIDETDAIAAFIAEKLPLEGAVVRLRYRASADRARRIDHNALRGFVEDAGGVKLVIRPEILRADRARVEGVDESLSELEALQRWSDVHDLDPLQRERLATLTTTYLEAA